MKRNTQESEAGKGNKINRRQALKWGLVAGGSAAFYIKRFHAGADELILPGVASPYTRPFIQPLPIPSVYQPVAALSPAPDPDRHQGSSGGMFGFGTPLLYEVHVKEAMHSFHPQLPPSPVWGYDGLVPGPTMIGRYGQPMLYRFYNDLPSNHVGFGVPEISVHLHNGHTASESDGFPGNFFGVGQWWDNHYPNILAGGDIRETMGTLWYHDHRFDFTVQNVYKGLAGVTLLFDHLDSGDENDPNPDAFRLPSGEYDVPLVFADKVFDQNGQVFFDLFNLDGILGDRFTVNGKIQPFFKVARRKYRFRLLDAGPSRFWQFHLSDNRPFKLISNDGNLLERPLEVESVRIGVAERVDIIIDFSQYNIGDSVILENRLEQFNGRGPTGGILNPGIPLLRFDIDRDPPVPDNSQVPSFLRELPPIHLNEVAAERVWTFNRQGGAWTINDLVFNVNQVRATPKQGTAEIWTLQNLSGGWSHPIHIHFEEGQILTRNGQPPPPHERARKDVYVLGPNEVVRIFMRFRDWLGRYPMHCHNTIHEDHAMMLRWDLVP